MYPVNWIDTTGWDLYKYLPEYPKKICIVANTFLHEFWSKTRLDMRIFLYTEPSEIIPGIDQYCRSHYGGYDYILTWNEDIINSIPNARRMIYIDPWITKEFVDKEKKFKISFLSGVKDQTVGHRLRLNIYSLFDRVNMPHDFYRSMDFNRHSREESLFSDSQFNLAIENSIHNNYFTEKILDCFLTKTIPFYYGCPNIGIWFDTKGIIRIESMEDFFNKVNSIDESYYISHLDSVNKNFETAKEMCKDLGTGGYKTLDRKLNELMREKYGYNRVN